MLRIFIAAALAAALPCAAQNSAVHVLASNGVRAVIEEVKTKAERSIGHPLTMEFETSSALKQKIESGEAFDAAIMTSDLIDELARQGKIVPGSRAVIARAGIGVGVRKGAPKPDIHDVTALKQTLLLARSVTYAEDGASRVHLEKMFETLGIAAAMKPKIMLVKGSSRADQAVADGKADLVLTLNSEILPASGVTLIGPLPEIVQSYIVFSAGVGPKAANAGAAQALVKLLASPEMAPILKAKGMEAVKR